MRMGHASSGNGVTAVITDFRCNQHITASGSFERAVRLPAAIKGAKNAGAGSPRIPLVTKIEEKYMDLAEEKILPKAHNGSYLKRIKDKIAALPPDAKGVPLTDDSDGEGGEDTSKHHLTNTVTFTLFHQYLTIFHCLYSGFSWFLYCCCSRGRICHPSRRYGDEWEMCECILCSSPSWAPCWKGVTTHECCVEWILSFECCSVCRTLCGITKS